MKAMSLALFGVIVFCIVNTCSGLAQSIETLIPTPRTAWNYPDTSRFRLGAISMLVLPDTPSVTILKAAAWLERQVQVRCGITLQRRTIYYYLRSVPPFQSAIVLLPSNDKDTAFFRQQLLAHGEDAPPHAGGYILNVRAQESVVWCRPDDESSFNGVTTLMSLLQGSTKSIAQCHIWDEPDYPIRWLFSQHNLQVTSNVALLRSLADTMASLKLNGIYQNDFKLGILDRVSSQYFRNTDTLKRVWQERNVEVIPGVCGLGWSSNILLRDNQLAEGLEARSQYVIEADTGRLIANSSVRLANGGFENVDASSNFTGYSFYDTCFHQDKSTFHSGTASAKATNIPLGSNARFNRALSCKPHEYYSLSAWCKTSNCTADEFRLLVLADTGVNQYAALTFTNLDIAATADWQKVEVFFNTLNYTKILVYVGIWGARGGTLWVDDFEIKPAGLCNVLRRPGTPLTLRNVSTSMIYTEGVDFNTIRDSWFDAGSDAIGPYHTPPTIRRASLGSLRNGDTVEVRYFHPFAAVSDNHGNGSVMVCPSEDILYAILDRQIQEVNNLYHPQRYFMGHDEIRNMNHDDACVKRGLSPAHLLADNISRCDSLIHRITPNAQTFIWSDMLDSLHNAINNYYLINGDLRTVWNLCPTTPVIVNWNGNKAKQSLNFFSNLGFSQISSPYYDVGNSSTIRNWRVLQEGVKNVLGMMYTTWNADYRFLRPFAYYSWSAGPYIIHSPIDSSTKSAADVTFDADVYSDPYDLRDSIVRVTLNIWNFKQLVDKRSLAHPSANSWRTSAYIDFKAQTEYSITAVNAQGITKETPRYRLGKKGDIGSDVTLDMPMVHLYPQPVSNELRCVVALSSPTTCHISIYDVSGRLELELPAQNIECTEQGLTLDVRALDDGYHMLQVRHDARLLSIPFVKMSFNR